MYSFICSLFAKFWKLQPQNSVILIDWLTDLLIDWLIAVFSIQEIHTITTIYGLYDSHNVFLFSVFYEIQMIFIFFFSTKSFCVLLKNESNKRGRHRSSSTVYTEWEGITNPIFLTPPLMISSILYHTLHYNKSVSELLISQLFLQSLRPRNLSFIHRVRVERSRLSPVRQSVALHQHSVIWGHLIWFPLFVLGCRSTVPAFT